MCFGLMMNMMVVKTVLFVLMHAHAVPLLLVCVLKLAWGLQGEDYSVFVAFHTPGLTTVLFLLEDLYLIFSRQISSLDFLFPHFLIQLEIQLECERGSI